MDYPVSFVHVSVSCVWADSREHRTSLACGLADIYIQYAKILLCSLVGSQLTTCKVQLLSSPGLMATADSRWTAHTCRRIAIMLRYCCL